MEVKVTTQQFLSHVRSWPLFIKPSQKRAQTSTSIFGIYVTDLEQAKIATVLEKAGYLTVEETFFGKDKVLKYTITDAGRWAARGDEQTLTLEAAREMHDSDLDSKWTDHPIAKQVLAGRGRAAQQLRLVLARVYGKYGVCTHSYWNVVPCLTPSGTIGILDVAKGTAWETGIVADDGVHDLGLAEDVCAGANGISGDCYIDKKLVQRDGSAVDDSGNVIIPKMPIGWRQIGLPTWRGYDPDAKRYTEVPEALFKPEHWIKPTLVASGLMTCYGRPGYDDGTWLDECHGWESKYPWGVPPWINGQSVTLLDTMADTLGVYGDLARTHVPRGTDEEELQFLKAIYDVLLQEFAPRFKKKAEEIKDKKLKHYSSVEVRKGLEEAAMSLADGKLPSEAADKAVIALGNESTGLGISCRLPQIYRLRAAEKAIQNRLPYAAAVNIAMVGNALY